MTELDFQPVFIIGAARSGTKLLRDQIARHPAVARVPYDVNYIWRFGNEKVPHDELTPEMLTPQICQRIRSRIAEFSEGKPVLVEKTVSNCLRIPFVQAVFPEARFIHLVRHPLDVIESSYRQWTAKPDFRYIFAKLRSFPFTESFGYGVSYAFTTLRKLILREPAKAGTCGPRYAGIDIDVLRQDLLNVCAIQWVRCVTSALRDFEHVDSNRLLTVRYEDFVIDPSGFLDICADFIGLEKKPYQSLEFNEIFKSNVGRSRSLPDEKIQMLVPLVKNEAQRLIYNLDA